LGLILAVAVSTDVAVDAGVDGIEANVLDITVDSTKGGRKRVSILLDKRTYYELDDGQLPDRLVVELREAGLSSALSRGNSTIQMDSGPISSIDAQDDQNMRRVYVYIELSGEIEYAVSPDSYDAKEVLIEINPSSRGVRRQSNERETQLPRPSARRSYRRSRTEMPSYRSNNTTSSTKDIYISKRSSNTLASIKDVYVEDAGGGIIALVIEADAPIYPQVLEGRSGFLIKIPDCLIAWTKTGSTPRESSQRLSNTGRRQRTSLSSSSKVSMRNQFASSSNRRGLPLRSERQQRSGTLRRRADASLRSGVGSLRDNANRNMPSSASRILPVNKGAIRHITVNQKSSNPALVEIAVDEQYLTEYQNIPQESPNIVVYEIDTQRRKTTRRTIPSTTSRYNPNSGNRIPFGRGRIKGDAIILRVGHSLTLETGRLEYNDTISLGDPKVAGILTNASNDLVINGISRGVTNLAIQSRRHGEVANYQVYVYDDKEWLEGEILDEIGGQVDVRVLNGTIFLEGTVETKEQSDGAEKRAKALSIDGGTVINNLKVNSPFDDNVSRQIELKLDEYSLNDVEVISNGDKIILTGTVPSDNDSTFAESIANFYAEDVVNNVTVALPGELASQIESDIGMPKVRVRVANGSAAILSGEVTNEADKSSAEEIAKIYVPKVTNLLEVKPVHLLEEDIISLIGSPNIKVRWSGNILHLTGTASSQIDADFAKKMAERIAGDNNVVSNIEVISQDKIHIRVKVVEISTALMSQIGIGWPREVTFAESFVPTSLQKMGRPIRLSALNASIRALVEEGKADIRLNYNLTVMSGETASILAGGQIPLFGEAINPQGVTQAVFGERVREYGEKLHITPTVDADGIIKVDLSSEVSGIDSTPFQTPSGPVSTLSAKNIKTTLPMRSGATEVMGGLIRQRESEYKTRVPLLGHIPLLGRLFTTTQKEKNETELVFILTATIVTDTGMNGHLNPLDQNAQKNRAQFDIEDYLKAQKEQGTVGDRKPFKW